MDRVDPIGSGLVTSLAHPGGNISGVSLFDYETYAKRLQILKDIIPTASRVAFLAPRRAWESGQGLQRALQDVGRRLDISVIPMLIEESTPSEYQRVFAEIVPQRADGLIVPDVGDLVPYRQLIVGLAEKSRLPAIFGTREYVEAGGLMAYGADQVELFRRMADDVHEILNGTKTRRHPNLSSGEIPIHHQFESRQGRRPHHPSRAARPRRRGHRMRPVEVSPPPVPSPASGARCLAASRFKLPSHMPISAVRH
jgi:putative ABC transport system substrate-binding protein